VPVLARLFEAAGMSTVLVTNMPFWSERVGAPRSLAVEFPFGHILGPPRDRDLQRRVILQALDLLERSTAPGAIAHFPEPWPQPFKEALRAAQPETPPPISGAMGRHIGNILRGMRRGAA
jgi:hypothetical protein